MKTFQAVAAGAAACLTTCAAQAATVTVYSNAQLASAIGRAAAGDTIKVAPGKYGAVEIKNLNPASAITIVAANSARLPVFTDLRVLDSSNLIISRLNISAPAPSAAVPVVYGATVARSRDIRLSGMVINGVLGGGVVNEPRGLRLSKSENITVTSSSFTELSHALTVDASSRLTITDNGFTGIRTDGIMLEGATSSVIARNRFADFRPEAGDHPDAIQLFNTGNPSFNLTINDNLMIGDAAGQMQGVFMTNASGIRSQLHKVNITNNTMWGTMFNGVSVQTAKSVTVNGNMLYSNGLLDANKTWVRLEEVSTGTVMGNYAGAYIYNPVTNLVQGGNVLSVLDAAAAAAVLAWDATHVASALSIAYNDPLQSTAARFMSAGSTASAAGDLASLAGDSSEGFNRQALAAVPEPASWAMMIAGFGFIGTMRRRLQRRTGRRMARG